VPIRPTSREPISVLGGGEISPAQYLSLILGNPPTVDGDPRAGWCFFSGDPEFWKFSDQLVVPGGKVLDLGVGFGRTSFPFALQGMEVVGYEFNYTTATSVRRFVKAYPFLPIKIRNQDIRTANLGRSEFDTAILGETFNHFEDRESAYAVLDKTLAALKPGGAIYIRASSTMDSDYEDYANGAGWPVNKHLFIAPCNCSGETKSEPQLFFEQTELLEYFLRHRTTIIHSQLLPQRGQMNIMYGEDSPEGGVPQGGAITIIAQKK